MFCLFRQVRASNDASHKLFSLYVHIPRRCSSSSLSSQHSCLPRVLVPSILPANTVCRRDSLLGTWPNQYIRLCGRIFGLVDWILDQLLDIVPKSTRSIFKPFSISSRSFTTISVLFPVTFVTNKHTKTHDTKNNYTSPAVFNVVT